MSVFYLALRCSKRENRKYETEKEAEKVIEILARLFPYFGMKIGKTMEMYDLDLFRKNNRIAHPEKFERYFDLNVEYIDLRTAQVSNAIHGMKQEELSAYIIELDKEEAKTTSAQSTVAKTPVATTTPQGQDSAVVAAIAAAA